jgi:hypothetical protein
MKNILALMILMGACFAQPKPKPTGLKLAATWNEEERSFNIDYAHGYFGEDDEADYLIYKMCVNAAPWPTLRPTQPANIKICNGLIDDVKKSQTLPKW